MNRTIIISLIFLIPFILPAQDLDVLKGIQHCFDEALTQSFVKQQNEIAPLIEKLELAQVAADHSLLAYWQAYGHYQEGIYFMRTEQNKEGLATLKKGIDLLEEQPKLDAESHVMIGSLMSLMISFSPGQAMSLSSKSGKHFQKAVKLEPSNLRGYLALGRSDFYKPKMYGGGKKVEEYLLKALSLEDQVREEPYLPHWGRESVYMVLVQYYQREGRSEEAKMFCKQGLGLFPESYVLNQLNTQL